jgi:hypothetical protein
MKKTILSLVVFFIGYNLQAQNNIQYPDETKHLIELENGLYKAMIHNDAGKLSQVGFYKEHVNGKLMREGKWKLYNTDNGEVLTVAVFQGDKLVWIKADGVKYTAKEIERHRGSSNPVVVMNQ